MASQTLSSVSSHVFSIISQADVDKLVCLSEAELRPILPCLVRMALCASIDTSSKWTKQKQKLLQVLSGAETVNTLVALLSIDFHSLEQDAKKEKALRSKLGGEPGESVLVSQLSQGIALEFERSDAARKLRLVLSELLAVQSQINPMPSDCGSSLATDFFMKKSELFESEAYLEEVSDVLAIAQAELPTLLPVSKLAEILLHISHGDALLCRVVANAPDTFQEACKSVISNCQSVDPDSKDSRQRLQVICELCRMNPSQVLNIRSICVEYCKLPALAIALTLNGATQTSDLAPFVSGLLLSNDGNVKEWFSQFIKNGQKKKYDSLKMLPNLRAALMNELHQLIPEGANYLPESNVVRACTFVRLYCALKGVASLKFCEEEVNELLRLLTSRPPATAAGARFVSLAICMLIACPHVLGSQEQEKVIIDWIRWILQEEAVFDKSIGKSSSYIELLVLIAIHFHSHHTHAIGDLVCSVLGMKSAVKSNALAKVKSIFTQEVFTEQVITSYAVKVPVTTGLNSNIPGYLPAHCIHQLLKTRAFSRYKVSIKSWIYQQICQSKLPIHPVLPPLIEAYANSTVCITAKVEYTNEPISEQEILTVFSSFYQHVFSDDKSCEDRNIVPHLLLLYYVLLHEASISFNARALAEKNRMVQKYSESLLAQLPIKFLLEQAQKQPQNYKGLFSSLLRLLATLYPNLCLVEDWIREDAVVQSHPTMRGTIRVTTESLMDGFLHLRECPTKLVVQLETLATGSMSTLLSHADLLVDNMICLLDDTTPRKVLDLINKIWFRLNTVMPRKLRVGTYNALRVNKVLTAGLAVSEEDLTIDPLNVLRCDGRVFRCPPIFEILLQILNSCLQMSRAFLASQYSDQKFDPEKEELKNALIAAQDSAVIQILLECCLPAPQTKVSSICLSNLHEVQRLTCSYLHQMFIADPNLVKLVHFQGYPSELLPITVGGIPSMHICLDFIPELLSQPHWDKQIFGTELISYLCLQYALPKSMGVARLTINVLSTMLTVIPSDTRTEYFLHVLPALERICKAFPVLITDVITLLVSLARICTAHGATLESQASVKMDDDGSSMEDKLDSSSKFRRLDAQVKKSFSTIAKQVAMS